MREREKNEMEREKKRMQGKERGKSYMRQRMETYDRVSMCSERE